ncbi:MAG: hypothetical protein KJ065_09785 [Anaerolineae bacterium]|nr:hypothetical protein [Anaerolineae bacterium]
MHASEPADGDATLTSEALLFTELFPIRTEGIGRLYAYAPIWNGDGACSGAKLAYHLRRDLGGQWHWLDGRLITDTPPNPARVLITIDALRTEHPALFAALTHIEEDLHWRATPEAIAAFVMRGRLADLDGHFVEALARAAGTIKNARVVHEPYARTWVIGGQPTLALAVITRVLYAQDVTAFASALPDVNALTGLAVVEKLAGDEGTIVKVLGTVAEQRKRLLQHKRLREWMGMATDDMLALRIAVGSKTEDYPANALDLRITPETASRFDVIPGQVERALQLKPDERARLVKVIADIAKDAGLIGDAYSQRNLPEYFKQVTPRLSVVWGNDKIRPYDPRSSSADFAQHGLYQCAPRYQTEPLRLAVLNAQGDVADIFVEALAREFERAHPVRLKVTRTRAVQVLTPENLQTAVRALAKADADVLLACLPDAAYTDPAAPEQFLKAQAVGRALPSLILFERTLHDIEAMPRIIMGLLARAGNTPFIFEEPLPYADRIVGLAIRRTAKKGSDDLTAIARYYGNRGLCQGWRTARALVSAGAGLTSEILAHLLPPREINARRVLIHVDGRLDKADAQTLTDWEAAHDAALYPVEITAEDVPRLYAFANRRIELPARGAAFTISEREALLFTAAPPLAGTPAPLHVRCFAPLRIEHVLDSIEALALLHHGAPSMPSLPVTLLHTDEWKTALERGVFPDATAGETAWWL